MYEYGKLFIDSTAWINLTLIGEPFHEQAIEIFGEFAKGNQLLFTSNDVVDETVTRLRYRVNLKVASEFFVRFQENLTRKTVVQLWTDEKVQDEAWKLLQKFHEHQLSLTDATSIALLRRFNLDAIVTFDEDFKKVGIPAIPT